MLSIIHLSLSAGSTAARSPPSAEFQFGARGRALDLNDDDSPSKRRPATPRPVTLVCEPADRKDSLPCLPTADRGRPDDPGPETRAPVSPQAGETYDLCQRCLLPDSSRSFSAIRDSPLHPIAEPQLQCHP
jgi:hypothetical protein